MKTTLLALTASFLVTSPTLRAQTPEPSKSPEMKVPATRAQKLAAQILEDLKMISAMKDQCSIEHKLEDGHPVKWEEMKDYMFPDTRLGMLEKPIDIIGEPIELGVIGAPPRMSKRTAGLCASVLHVDLKSPEWKPFVPGE